MIAKANITLTVDLDVVAAEEGATPEEIAKQESLVTTGAWLADLHCALLDLDDSPGIVWTVEAA